MALHLLVYLQIILLLSPIEASHEKCQDICGNFRIWYPFGIGEGCYFDKSFEVTCDNSSNSPRAFLTSINMELSYGLFSKGLHYYSSQRAVVNTDGNILNDSQKFLQKLSGSPFTISKSYNMLIAFGCHPSNTSGECLSFCNCDTNRKYSCCDFWCRLSPNRTLDGGNKLSNYRQLQGCTKSPFVADKEWLEADYLLTNRSDSVLREKAVPVSLDWGKKIGRCVELYNPSQTICNKDKICLIQLNSGDYYCVCDDERSDYYQGCSGDLICNTTANSNCSKCPDGYSLSPYKTYQEFQCSSSKSLNQILKRNARVKFLVIIGCSVGVGMLLLLIGAWWLYKFIKRRKAIKLKQKFFKRNGGLLLKQRLASNNEGNIVKTKLFTSKELKKATNNYNTNRILGQGGQGTVYKGMLAEGQIVAVKKSKIVDKKKVEEFVNEVVILSQISHRNVVKLLGCCLETEVPLLIYEFIPNGTLFQHIHDENEEFPITWEMRLRIAIEVANALYYLHSGASVPIYHRDVKSTNILLDEKYRAKVSDFGTSRSVTIDQTHLTTHVQGTFGYVDPEYFQSSQFTEKSDVYSFGVVLAELLTGEKSIRSTHTEENRGLVAYFLNAIEENRLFEVLDTNVLKEGGKEEIMKVANLTRRCLNPNGKKRPTMREVATELAGNIGALGCKAFVAQENYREIDYLDIETTSQFTTGSSSNIISFC